MTGYIEKKVTCDCGKVIRGKTDEELVSSVQAHAQQVHAMELSRDQVLAMSEPA
jgi:predicted small metal-binding protein